MVKDDEDGVPCDAGVVRRDEGRGGFGGVLADRVAVVGIIEAPSPRLLVVDVEEELG